MPKTQEQARKVIFEQPLSAYMMAIDGTWRRACQVKEVSDLYAILQVEGSLVGLSLTEFFLVLSPVGLAYRRCQMEGLNGQELEVTFLRQEGKKARGS